MNIVQDLTNRIERTTKLLERLHETLELARDGKFKYRVTIQSAWSDYGEKPGVGEGCTPEIAEQNAENHFREINERAEIQESSRTIVVVFSNDFVLSPHQFTP